jgi:hypothetical protein
MPSFLSLTVRAFGPISRPKLVEKTMPNAEFMQDFLERATRLAGDYDYSTEGLYFEYQRRLGGSFATTLSGSREQRDLFLQAWKVAMDRKQTEGRS